MGIASLGQLIRRTLLRVRDGGGLSDGHLLERFVARRDQAAFEELVRRHGPMVFRVCQRVLGQAQDAEDAFQATFVVLARRANRIVKHASVGSWLHGVAYRVSLQARKRNGRGVQGCGHGDLESFPGYAGEQAGSDLRAVLDEELQALPEKLRAPVVLCYFEGKTNAAAAQLLGYSTNTIEKQLIKARAVLRQRLERRGVTLSASGLAAVLAGEAQAAVPASAAVSPSLAALTLQSVLAADGGAPAGALAPSVAALAEAMPKRTGVFGKILLALFLAVCVAGYCSLPSALPPPSMLAALEGHTGRVTALVFSPDNQTLVSTSWDGTAKIWEPATKRLRATLSPQESLLFTPSVAFSPDSGTFALADGDGRINLYDPKAGKERNFLPQNIRLIGLGFSSDGKQLAAVQWNARIIVRDVATTTRETSNTPKGGRHVSASVFSPDGRIAAISLNKQQELILCDPATGRERSLGSQGPSSLFVPAIAFGPEGRLLACATESEISLWNVAVDPARVVWKAAADGETALALAPDGLTLASSHRDGTVQVRDSADGKLKVRFKACASRGAWAVAFAPDGRSLATSGDDGIIKLWDLSKLKQ